MYLSKNSRSFLRKSSWFPSYMFGRNFVVSCADWRVRWPDDDPLKPPLRVNIPKDSVSGSYQFEPQMRVTQERVDMTDRFSPKWIKSPHLRPDSRHHYSNGRSCSGNDEEGKPSMGPHPGNTLEGKGNSETGDNQNFTVKSETHESFKPPTSGRELRYNRRKREKNFKLRKVRSYEGTQFGNPTKQVEDEDKSDVLTIQIALDEQTEEGDKQLKKLSRGQTSEEAVSDDQIRALAETIANELKTKDGTKSRPRASEEKGKDDAYLVIINVTDNDNLGNVADPSATSNRTERYLSHEASPNTETQDVKATSSAENYGGRQVRHLDTTDDLEQYTRKKNVARTEPWKKSKKTKSVYGQTTRERPDMRYIISGSSVKADLELNQASSDFFRSNKNLIRSRDTRSPADLLEEKEKRRITFERSLRNSPVAGNNSDSKTKTFERYGRRKELIGFGKDSKRMGTFAGRSAEPARRVEHPLGKELKMQTKTVLDNYLKKGVATLGGNFLQTGEPHTSSFVLKPLSKQIRMIDELPELLKYPEYKYSVLRRNPDDDRFHSRTIRSYHNSCVNCRKLTEDTTEDKSALAGIRNLEETVSTNNIDNTLTSKRVTKSDGDALLDSDILWEDYSISKLDNSYKTCSEMSDNDIYLQEGNVIGNIVPPTATKKIESSKSETKSAGEVKTGSSKSEGERWNEKYERGVADVGLGRTTRLEGSYGMTLPVGKSAAAEGHLKPRDNNLILEFENLYGSKIEVNPKSVQEPASDTNSGAEKKSPFGEYLLNSKKDATMNVVKEDVSTPKLSDNIVNLANEEIAEDKGTANVDSLSLMKRVKEIVDLDLKNAEKIFSTTDSASEEHHKSTGKSLAQERVNVDELKSVVIHNEQSDTFYVKSNELDSAKDRRLAELRAECSNPIGETPTEKADSKSGTPVYVQKPKGKAAYVLKKGDSIIIYDESRKQWNVDLSLLSDKSREKGKENNKNDGPTDKLQVATELKEERPGNVQNTEKNVSKKDKDHSDAKGKDDAGKTCKKDPTKEMDAQEIRKKNSDLYDDVFDTMKQGGVKKESELEEPKKKADSSEHYVSKNIVEMSKSNNASEASKKLKSSKIETVKLNITSEERPPSKVKEINLKQNLGEDKGGKENEAKKQDGGLYRDLEKYKTPFTDPEYEEKQLKINSDEKNNPNLKKLNSWNKTLVLQGTNKSNENIESWIKDETDKMATLLLRVLQEAAQGNNRRRTAAKTSVRGNPYETIRKKQENGETRMKKKDSGRKRIIAVDLANGGNKILGELAQNVMGNQTRRKEQAGDEYIAEIARTELLLPKDALRKIGGSSMDKENQVEDIPGPIILKRLSSLWKFLPELGCQASIFVTIGMFSLAKVVLSLLKSDTNKSWNGPFGGLFKKYGPIVKIHGPLSGNVVLINRPEDITSVFTQSQSARSVFDSLEHCRSQVKQKNLPMGITDWCNGIDWDMVRQSTIDVSSKGRLHYFNMLKYTNSMLVNKIEKMRNKQKQVPDNFLYEVKKWSLEGLCGILFDKSIGFQEHKNSEVYWVCESERLLRNFQEATSALCQCESKFQLWRFLNTPAMNTLSQAYQSLDLIVSKYVYQAEVSLRRKRKALSSQKLKTDNTLNFLESVLLNDRMSPEELTACIIDMLLIGVNTSTAGLGFLLYNLAQNGCVQRNLYKEVKDLLRDKNSEVNYQQLQSLKYLRACLKESMRINVPIPLVLRILPSDIFLAQYAIPYGTHLVMDTQTACMKEQYFHEPERFKPERWLDQGCIHPFSSIPFSNGPREGFVRHMAEIHLLTCIAKIVRNYQIEYHFGEIRPTGGVLSYPDKPLKLTFVERED